MYICKAGYSEILSLHFPKHFFFSFENWEPEASMLIRSPCVNRSSDMHGHTWLHMDNILWNHRMHRFFSQWLSNIMKNMGNTKNIYNQLHHEQKSSESLLAIKCHMFATIEFLKNWSRTHAPWWCHQIEKISVLLALCDGKPPVNGGFPSVTGGFPSQRPMTRGFDVFFDLAWTNAWANNLDAHDLRCHHAHHDVTVMHSDIICSIMQVTLLLFSCFVMEFLYLHALNSVFSVSSLAIHICQ